MAAAAPPPSPPPSARLFLALWPDDATRQAVLDWQAGWTWPPHARPTPPERLHLTLHFIGSVPRARLPALQAGLPPAGPPFDLELGRAEQWPRGLALLVPHALPPALAELHARLGDALQALGLPPSDLPYRPHVTLARHADGAEPPQQPLRCRWRATGYGLAESDRGYRPLARY